MIMIMIIMIIILILNYLSLAILSNTAEVCPLLEGEFYFHLVTRLHSLNEI